MYIGSKIGFFYETVIPLMQIMLSITGFYLVPAIIRLTKGKDHLHELLENKETRWNTIFLIAFCGIASFVLYWPFRSLN